MFSKLGDLLEPWRHKIGAELLTALQALRSCICAGFTTPNGAQADVYTDNKIESEYTVDGWEHISG
jgi:hypothetical protein